MLFLASQSPRRAQLLEQIGLRFELLDVHVPETPVAGEQAHSYVCRVARDKAAAGLLAVAAHPNAIVISADTEVVLDGKIFGKPADSTHAAQMLKELSGRSHQVLSAVVCVSAKRELQALCISEVTFAVLSKQQIASYVQTGEPLGKAGAYAIQGYAARFIERLNGSYSAVMGLPLFETMQMLDQFEHIQ